MKILDKNRKKIYNQLYYYKRRESFCVERISIDEFDSIYKIMEDSFPPTEFRPKNEQLALFENENYRIFGTKLDNVLISIAAVWDFDDFLFIEHLATAKKLRGNGIGSALLCELVETSNKIICLEVEPPEDELTKRRVIFYQRNGMFFNSFPYIQPSISKGQEPIPLFIMTSKSKIDKKTFETIKSTLYKNVYKCI